MNKSLTQKFVVIGSGFSGLVTSYYLVKKGKEVEILESSKHSGGLIATIQTEFGLVETAANGLLNCTELEDLCADLGIELIRTSPQAKKRFIFRDGKPRSWPLHFFETLQVIKFLIKFFARRSSVAPMAGETLPAWGERTLGSKVSHNTIEAAFRGIYGDTENLSASLVLKTFFQKNSSRKNPTKLGRGTVAPPGGMGELIKGLERYLRSRGVKFHFERKITSSHELPLCDHVIIATSGSAAAKLLKEFGDPRSKTLEQISISPLTTATLFSSLPAEQSIKGFGVLFPARQNRFALGVLRNNFIFENRATNCSSDTWIIGGNEQSEKVILDSLKAERQSVFTENSDLLEYKLKFWPEALPQYNTTLESIISRINVTEGKVSLIGNYLGEIGLRQILLRAKKLSEEL